MNELSDKEELDIEEITSEEEDLKIDNASYKINTYGADFVLEVLSQKLNNGEIVVPGFQRNYVWDQNRASKLIESFLLGLPVPQIFLYKEEETQDLLVVDGQQRLKSINSFFNERFEDGSEFYLKNVKAQWEGKKYSDLTEADKRRLKNSVLRATIFQQTDPRDDSSVFEIFNRLNTGGLSLTEQEIRNCVVGASRGYPNDYSQVKGKRIFGIDEVMGMNKISVFGAGIDVVDGELYANGGRLFSIVAEGEDILEAKQRAYSAIARINIEENNLHYRTDIGWRDIERLRKDHLIKYI